MNTDLIKRHWITGLGLSFIFLGFLYLLQQAIQLGWLPSEARVQLGIVAGSALIFAGHLAFEKKRSPLDEILAGLGAALCYATFTYASFLTPPMWSSSTLLICVLVLSAGITGVAYVYEKRVLVALSLAGGLIAPIVLRVPGDLIFVLFLYAVVLNLAALIVATLKGWSELKVVTFLLTFILYSVYYGTFRPTAPGEPLFYICAFFAVYFFGLLLGTGATNRDFNGISLYLNMINCGALAFWSIYLLNESDVGYTVPLMLLGLLYVLASVVVAAVGRGSKAAVLAYFFVGLFVLAVSTGNLERQFETEGMHYVVNSLLWGAIAFALYLRGHMVKIAPAAYAGVAVWCLTLLYWFVNAWSVAWPTWFGLPFIPFLNPGALVWICMAGVGFFMARGLRTLSVAPDEETGDDIRALHDRLGLVISLVAHGVLAGLFTIQLRNIWVAYDVDFFRLDLLLSTAYTLHALLIFLWGAYMRIRLFRWGGSLVLGCVALKVLLFDLGADPTVMKAIYLMIMGAVMLGIGFVNARWKEERTEEEATSGPGLAPGYAERPEKLRA